SLPAQRAPNAFPTRRSSDLASHESAIWPATRSIAARSIPASGPTRLEEPILTTTRPPAGTGRLIRPRPPPRPKQEVCTRKSSRRSARRRLLEPRLRPAPGRLRDAAGGPLPCRPLLGG